MIALYCPDVPPVPGGVSDHTLALARALERLGAPPVVLAGRGDPDRFEPLRCATGVEPGAAPAAARELGAHALLVQYVPFLFARSGVSLAVTRLARRAAPAGLALAVFVHEPFVPFTRLPWLVTGALQRLQLRTLLARASFVYTAVPRFAELVRRAVRPGTPVRLAPVGATIPVSTATRSEARAALGLADGDVAVGVFSPAASGFRHDWIAAAAARLGGHPRVRWVRFGFGSARDLPGYPAGPRTIVLGEGEPTIVARTMRALDLVLAPYVDGLTLRRTGAMLGLATGVATVSATGPLFDGALASLADCLDSPAAFAARVAELVDDAAARAALAARAGGFAGFASTETLAAMLVADLGRARAA